MTQETFYRLFLQEIRKLYSIENQLVDALPVLLEAASSPDLREAIEINLEETRNQLKRLQKIFAMLNEKVTDIEYPAIKSLVQEGKMVINSDFPDLVKDAALIAAIQCIEHYEIACYGTAKTFAKELGLDECVDLLKKTLDEESHADSQLNDLAEGGLFTAGINRKARR